MYLERDFAKGKKPSDETEGAQFNRKYQELDRKYGFIPTGD